MPTSPPTNPPQSNSRQNSKPKKRWGSSKLRDAEVRAAVIEWFTAQGLTYKEVSERLKLRFGITASVASLGNFWRRQIAQNEGAKVGSGVTFLLPAGATFRLSVPGRPDETLPVPEGSTLQIT